MKSDGFQKTLNHRGSLKDVVGRIRTSDVSTIGPLLHWNRTSKSTSSPRGHSPAELQLRYYGVTGGVRTRDNRSHNPGLYQTELQPPLFFTLLRLRLRLATRGFQRVVQE